MKNSWAYSVRQLIWEEPSYSLRQVMPQIWEWHYGIPKAGSNLIKSWNTSLCEPVLAGMRCSVMLPTLKPIWRSPASWRLEDLPADPQNTKPTLQPAAP